VSEKKSVLRDKSFGFAVDCIILNQELTESRKEFVISKQFLRSGTSIGANIREA
jgi:four helix bundle protein